VEGGSLAGKESARVLSNIFSRVARTLPISVRRSSGSLFGWFGVTECEVIGISNLHTLSLVFCAPVSSIASLLAALRLPKPGEERGLQRHRAKSSSGTGIFPQILLPHEFEKPAGFSNQENALLRNSQFHQGNSEGVGRIWLPKMGLHD